MTKLIKDCERGMKSNIEKDEFYTRTIYGFYVEDLMRVAILMREEGLTPEDIKELVNNWDLCWETLGNMWKEQLEKSLLKELGVNDGG